MKAIKFTIEPIIRDYEGNGNFKTTVHEFEKYIYFSGLKLQFSDILRFIGNEGLDNWKNVDKIKKSSSNKNRENYISKYIQQYIDFHNLIN